MRRILGDKNVIQDFVDIRRKTKQSTTIENIELYKKLLAQIEVKVKVEEMLKQELKTIDENNYINNNDGTEIQRVVKKLKIIKILKREHFNFKIF